MQSKSKTVSKIQLEETVEDEFDGGGPLHKDASGNFTPRSVQQLEKTYQKIKDTDDTELNQWERIMRVNRFMLDQQVRQLIQNQFKPILESHSDCVAQVQSLEKNQIQSCFERLDEIEMKVFGKNSKFNMLDMLTEQTEIIKQQSFQKHEELKICLSEVQEKFSELKFWLQSANKEMESLKAYQQQCKNSFDQQEVRMLEINKAQASLIYKFSSESESNIQRIKSDLELHQKSFQKSLQRQHEENKQFNSAIAPIPQLVERIRQSEYDIQNLNATKLDVSTLKDIDELSNKINKCTILQQQFNNHVEGCQNYIDKYLPVQIHREITRYMMFVLSKDREIKNRIDWYDEIKMPLLTTLILCDTGKQALAERAAQLHQLCIDKIQSVDGDDSLTDEEKFMKQVISSRQKHAKAKLLIMQFIGLILNDKHKLPTKGKSVYVDPQNTSVTLIFQMLNHQLETDIQIKGVQRFNSASQQQQQNTDDDSQVTERLTPKEQMEKLIAEVLGEYQQRFQLTLKEMRNDVIEDMTQMQQKHSAYVLQRQESLEYYMNQVHANWTKEQENNKAITDSFLKSMQQTDSKLQVFCNIEQNNQILLKQMHALSLLVGELSEQCINRAYIGAPMINSFISTPHLETPNEDVQVGFESKLTSIPSSDSSHLRQGHKLHSFDFSKNVSDLPFQIQMPSSISTKMLQKNIQSTTQLNKRRNIITSPVGNSGRLDQQSNSPKSRMIFSPFERINSQAQAMANKLEAHLNEKTSADLAREVQKLKQKSQIKQKSLKKTELFKAELLHFQECIKQKPQTVAI